MRHYYKDTFGLNPPGWYAADCRIDKCRIQDRRLCRIGLDEVGLGVSRPLLFKVFFGLAEALALKPLVKLEDLHVMANGEDQDHKKGSRTYRYWMATWRKDEKTRNILLGQRL